MGNKTRRCTKCGETLPETAFGRRGDRKHLLRSHCKQCNKSYQKPETKKKHANKRTKRGLAFIKQAKDKPCLDCKQQFHPAVMEFDHVRGEKRGNVGLMSSYAIKTIQAEIDKCDVVCANCHRLRTYNRASAKGWDECFKRRRKD